MALTKEQITEIEKAAAKYMYYNRPPLEIRDKLDLGYRIEGQNVRFRVNSSVWDSNDGISISEFINEYFDV
jgi:hypothetical protein